MHTPLFLVLPRNKTLLFAHAVVVLGNPAAQHHRRFGGVLFIELQFHVEFFAFGLEFLNALFCCGSDIVHQLNGSGALDIVGGLVGVAGHQHTFAATLFDHTGALFCFFAALRLLGGTLVFGERGANLAARDARRAQLALLAVQAFRDRAVGRESSAVLVHAGIDTARGTLRGLRPRQFGAQGGQQNPAHDPRRCAQVAYPSLTPYRWR
ncbi:hypothetical protein D3C72_1539900 [compost metagenome]